MRPARLRPGDVLRVGAAGIRTRPTRVVLSALGIAIGIAAMIAVVGISTSSQANLARTLERLGTNLLTVSPGQSLFGEDSHLPDEAIGMVGRIGPVTSVSATGRVPDAKVYRNDKIPTTQSGSIAVLAARTDLPATVGITVADGTWLNDATAGYPAVALGSRAADRLGIARIAGAVAEPAADVRAGPAGGAAVGQRQVLLGGRWFTVIGILNPVELAPELDTAALIGWPVARSTLGFDGYPTTLYTRTRENAVSDVAEVLAATTNPANPNEVAVSRPSDALEAKQATDQAFTGLLLGLGAVALLVGGVGVANTMVISVLERRSEIGLRRSLGATRGQIRLQFLAESLILSALGGASGVVLGIGVTAAYSATQHWPTVVPAIAMIGGLGATLVIGAVAGLYPAVRAARLSPTQALTTG